ncbi:MAG: MBL fold metallo-hydrolase [Chthoniobacterales bacterium]
MAAAEEIQEVQPGVHLWQAYSAQAKVEITSHAVGCGGMLYLVDPIRLTHSGLSQLEELPAKVSAILLTNGNHERDSAFYRDRYGVPVFAHPEAAAEISIGTEPFPDGLNGLEVLTLPGAGAGEVGFYFPQKKLLILGDIVINLDSFSFAPLPDKYATDAKQMRRSLQLLTTLDVSTICFAHGLPVRGETSKRLAALVD